MMSELKTRPTDVKAEEFLKTIEPEKKRTDAYKLLELMKEVSGEDPVMWGSIVGFGTYTYKYASGKEGEWPTVGFAARKQNLTLYIMDGFDQYEALLSKLGKHKTGKSCLYINKLDDIDLDVLKEIVQRSVDHVSTSGRA
jgi:hypothetical protein